MSWAGGYAGAVQSLLTEKLNVRARWAAGACPCCGGALGAHRVAVAEGVWFCDSCVRQGHLEPPGFLQAMLAALAAGANS